MKKLKFQLTNVFILALLMTACKEQIQTTTIEQKDDTAAIYEGVEFDMPKVNETSFPDYTVSILEHGAVPDGMTSNTMAIADAIEAVSKKGGGKVIIPRGLWLTGPIQLKSNIHLHLEEGALVRFSRDFDEYPLVDTSFEGLNTVRCMSPIYAYNVENIALTGKGTIDGSGDAWRYVKKGKMTSS